MRQLVRAPERHAAEHRRAQVQAARRQAQRQQREGRHAERDRVDQRVRVVVFVDGRRRGRRWLGLGF